MTVKEFIALAKARIIEDEKTMKKTMVITVVGMPPEQQAKLESFAYKYKNDIVKELLKRNDSTPLLSLKKELHNYYIAKQREEEYRRKLSDFKRGVIDSFPVRPDTDSLYEESKLSPRAKAYIEADAFSRKNSGKKRKAAERAKQRIIDLVNGAEDDYARICDEMKNNYDQSYFCKTEKGVVDG